MIDTKELRIRVEEDGKGGIDLEEIHELLDRLDAAESARRDDYQNWMTALDRNAELLAKLEAAEKERGELLAKIERMEKQEPVGEIQRANSTGNYINSVVWMPMAVGSKLYALPGAQPAPSVPEDVMRDAERYRYLRARDDKTAGVGCWIEAEGRACDRGWLYGDQLDSAIDTCIEMLAAAPEAKP